MLFGDLSHKIKENFNRSVMNRKYENKSIVLSGNALTSSWIGGSIAGNMNKFGSYWISCEQEVPVLMMVFVLQRIRICI